MAIKLARFYPVSAQARAETDNRTIVMANGHQITIDEPASRGGSNQGATPLEVLVASFAGCTNVIANRLASEMGIAFEILTINVEAVFDTDILKVGNSVERPCPSLSFSVHLKTSGTAAQIDQLRSNLETTCPVSALFRAAGTSISSDWHIAPDSRG